MMFGLARSRTVDRLRRELDKLEAHHEGALRQRDVAFARIAELESLDLAAEVRDARRERDDAVVALQEAQRECQRWQAIAAGHPSAHPIARGEALARLVLAEDRGVA